MGAVKSPLLIKKGAEASLFLAKWHSRKAVMKKRLPKQYRLSILDDQIRTYRTIHEPQLMYEAKTAGVATPAIFLVDLNEFTIVMEFIEGKQVKQLLGEVSQNERRKLCAEIGASVGKLHNHGIVHGDLTTSNMILTEEGKLYFVDFGLGEKTKEREARAVDLHLMERALQSTHFRFANECFEAAIKGYAYVVGTAEAESVLHVVKEIEKRGRYVTERKGKSYD